MSNRYRFWIATCLAITVSACATFRPPQPPPHLETAKACADWRWIGISRPGAQCPDAPGWTVRPLFPQLAPAQDAREKAEKKEYCAQEDAEKRKYCAEKESEKFPSPELIRELNRFCVYEIGKKNLKKIPFPPVASAELVRLDRDCAGLSLSERYLDAKTWTTDSETVLKQAGKPAAPLQIDDQRGVRLAFLDTQPTSADVPQHQGHSPHGYTLAKIAQELVCAPEPNEPEPYKHCAAQITSRLALPIVKFNAKHLKHSKIDLEMGGFFGTQSDLAVAIREEVDDWLQQRSERSQQHLVLNLSLAWDGKLFGGLNGEQIADMQAGTQAIYRILEYAAGYDVLVLAAAGNQKEEPCVSFGPLLPAAWESEAPRERCPGEAEEPQLLYAVGGLRADGSPLANARSGGMPRRAAYGETTVFTGSSVATAIASSIAAVVWDYRPDLSSKEVMDILDGRNEDPRVLLALRGPQDPPSLTADFWFRASAPANTVGRSTAPVEAPPPLVRRLSLCDVLARACAGGGPCPLPPQCETLNWARRNSSASSDENSVARGSCQPWLAPQPEILPCPPCIPPDQ